MAKILLVEDDNNLREIYGARLSAEGHTIVSAKDGEEALAVAVKEKPDLIISDVMMPRISGFDMLDILRNAPETKDTKVIMMTALSQAEDKARADQLGADMYLVKSQVTLEDVAKAVDDILKGDTSGDSPADPTPTDPPAGGTPPVEPPVLPSDPAQAPDDASSQTSTDDATAAQSDQQPPATPVPAPADPAPEPEPEDEPVEPPAPTPSEPSQTETPAPESDTQKPVSESSFSAAPIEVVLPGDPNAEAPGGAEDSDKNVVQPAAPILPGDDNNANTGDNAETTSVGPNLAEALADEEKAVSDQIKKFEENAPTAPPPPAEPTAGASESANNELVDTAPQIEQPDRKTIKVDVTDPDPEPTEEEKKNESSEDDEDGEPSHREKVIEPSDDFKQGGPDLAKLVAEEAAVEAAKKSVEPGAVVQSTSGDGPKDPTQVIAESDHPNDEFSKIAL